MFHFTNILWYSKSRTFFIIDVSTFVFFKIKIYRYIYQLIPVHSYDYLNKISIKTNVETDEGNSLNEM